MLPEAYVVRIYRRGQAGELVGLVEAASSDQRAAFQSAAELVAIIGAPAEHLRPVPAAPGGPPTAQISIVPKDRG